MLRFLKLGGSLITEKTGVAAIRPNELTRIAKEIAQAWYTRPDWPLLIGHGSGSFGHVVAAKYGTRHGVRSAEAWQGFAEVGQAAMTLNHFISTALGEAGVPAVTLPPRTSAECNNGQLSYLALTPIQRALAANLVPLIMGDIAFDSELGGTIISTEEVMSYLVAPLQPSWLLLAGETDGVYDQLGRTIPLITAENLPEIVAALGGSRGTDVTGGMLSKVQAMLQLVELHPTLQIRIFSGLQSGGVAETLIDPNRPNGTVIAHSTIVNFT